MSATAVVTVTLKINVTDTWGDDCTVGQVKKQALDSASGILHRALKESKTIQIDKAVECIAVHYRA